MNVDEAVLRDLRQFLREEASAYWPATAKAFLAWLPDPDREQA